MVSACFMAPADSVPGARSAVLGERQVDETFDGIHGGHDDAQMRAGAQPPTSALAAPRVPVLLHDIQVIAQIIDVQQSVDRDVQDLHETAELHHGGDEPLESLSDALV